MTTFYTVLCDKKGYPVKYTSLHTPPETFIGPFGDPGEASQEFKACIGGEESCYLEPAQFQAKVQAFARWQEYSSPSDRPFIVCLCGSTRFMQAFQEANLRETLAGRIVLTVGCDTKSDAMLSPKPEQKTMLDELHKHKIDLADEILVLNVGGYIGESTASEIAHAQATCKKIRWLEGCYECGCVEGLITCKMCGSRCCQEHHFSTPASDFGDLFKGVEGNILECIPCGCK